MSGSYGELGFVARAKRRLKGLRRLRMFLSHERSGTLPVPLGTRLHSWRLGFTTLSWVLYDLDRNDPGLYVQDFKYRNYYIGRPYRRALQEKLMTTHLLRSLGITHPAPVALIRSGRILTLSARRTSRPFTGGDLGLDALLACSPGLVFRPLADWGGRGVFFVRSEDSVLEIDGRPVSHEGLASRLSDLDGYLVTEHVAQADYSSAIYPRTANTIRFLTLWDLETGEPYLAAAAHRIGTEASGVVDNFSKGRTALSAPVDFDRGTIGSGVRLGSDLRLARYPRHPDTDTVIEGVEVPYWHQTVDLVLRAAAAVPQIPFIGWDVLMTEQGACVLEVNSVPAIQLCQVHTPLLEDPRGRVFFDWLEDE